MKKLLLVICIFASSAAYASFGNLDLTVGYSRDLTNHSNGYMVFPGLYYSLIDEVVDVSIGLDAGYYAHKMSTGWIYSVPVIPTLRLQIPFALFKAGIGYDWTKDAGSSAITSFSGALLFLPVLGIDVTVAHRWGNASATIFSIGPVFTMGI